MPTLDELEKRYPALFVNRPYVAVGPAWIDLLARLCADLTAAGTPPPRLLEVKQKYTDLQICFAGGTEKHEELIRRYEREADTICPFCGDQPAPSNDCGYCRLGLQ